MQTKSNNNPIQSILDGIEEKSAEKKAREAARAANPPDLTPRPCLVAYIDILGFGHEIERAKTKADLERAYEKVRLVQKAFQKESAVDDPEEQAEMNADYGRRVIALSDAVVVVFTPNCPAVSAMGEYDHLGFAVFELIVGQVRCAVSHGIFVRGGLSHGPFFFEDDVLLSPALARAYELESEYAEHPLIVVPQATREAIFKMPKKGHYAPGADPTPKYFVRYGKRRRYEDRHHRERTRKPGNAVPDRDGWLTSFIAS